MPADEDTGNPGEDDAPRMTLWQRLRYSMVRPDDDPSETGPRRRSGRSRRSRRTSAAPMTRSEPSAWWSHRSPRWWGWSISSASVNYAKTHNQSTAVYDKLTYVLLGAGRPHPR